MNKKKTQSTVMSFINYTNYSAYPQLQVRQVVVNPPSGQAAPITASIPKALPGAYVLNVTNHQPVNNESSGLSPVQPTAAFGVKMTPALMRSQAQGLVPPAAYSALQGSTENTPQGDLQLDMAQAQHGFFYGSFYNPPRR